MKLLSVEEVAESLGVSRQTVGRMIQEGSLPAICLRSGKRKKVWRIRPEALDRWLREHETALKKIGNHRAVLSIVEPNGAKGEI